MDFWTGLQQSVPTWAYTVEGPGNQIFLVRRTLTAAKEHPALAGVARGLLLWAWQERPLEGEFTALLLEQDAHHSFLSPTSRRFLQALLPRLRPPGQVAGEIETLVAEHPEQAMDLAAGRLSRPEESLYWLGRLWEWSVRHTCWTRWPEWLKASVVPDLPDLGPRLEAQAQIMAGDVPEAARLAGELGPDTFSQWRDYLVAEGHLRAGDMARAVELFTDLWAAMPWHTNLTLKLHDLRTPEPTLSDPGADTVVCLYTWNKAELLAPTLEDLAISRLGGARIVALDNGSSDATPQVLARAQERFGLDRFDIVTLPVNVGAPPARNWLLSLPQVRACQRVAFLDDDVCLPPDWLARLLAASRRFPQAGAVGCRVLYVDAPRAIQMVDVHVLPPFESDRLPLLSNALGEPDLGLASYTRRSASVTGCCHLLTRQGLDRVGGFDVRYNPSQLDDLERDLRLDLAGLTPVYVGQLAVGHHKKSGPGASMAGRAGANATGNRIKLEAAFDDAQCQALREGNLAWAWDDLLKAVAGL